MASSSGLRYIRRLLVLIFRKRHSSIFSSLFRIASIEPELSVAPSVFHHPRRRLGALAANNLGASAFRECKATQDIIRLPDATVRFNVLSHVLFYGAVSNFLAEMCVRFLSISPTFLASPAPARHLGSANVRKNKYRKERAIAKRRSETSKSGRRQCDRLVVRFPEMRVRETVTGKPRGQPAKTRPAIIHAPVHSAQVTV